MERFNLPLTQSQQQSYQKIINSHDSPKCFIQMYSSSSRNELNNSKIVFYYLPISKIQQIKEKVTQQQLNYRLNKKNRELRVYKSTLKKYHKALIGCKKFISKESVLIENLDRRIKATDNNCIIILIWLFVGILFSFLLWLDIDFIDSNQETPKEETQLNQPSSQFLVIGLFQKMSNAFLYTLHYTFGLISFILIMMSLICVLCQSSSGVNMQKQNKKRIKEFQSKIQNLRKNKQILNKQ